MTQNKNFHFKVEIIIMRQKTKKCGIQIERKIGRDKKKENLITNYITDKYQIL